jgi:LmbE family N-acetylglucosaminyl deacetylase
MAPQTSGDLGTILGVWGHPDDEAYLAAGLMAHAVDAGRRVACVTATQGEAGFPGDDPRSPEERKAIRRTEMAASLAVLGVSEHHWLGYPDGGCRNVPDDEAVAALVPILEAVRPDTVLTFGPDGGTGHPDHIAAHRWATLAVAKVDVAGMRLLYSTTTDDWGRRFLANVDESLFMMVEGLRRESLKPAAVAVHFTCDDVLLDRKVHALRAQASQVEPLVEMVGADVFAEWVREEFYRVPRPDDPAVMAAVLEMKLR